MNGIIAVVTFDERSPEEVLLPILKWTEPPFATSKTTHKSYAFKNICLGTTSNEQIACDPSETIWVVFTGKLAHNETVPTNFSHLPDAAFVMEIYLQYGLEGFCKLDGEFSCLILDKKANELYAVRDRLGNFPLYWHVGKNLAIFSTSLKAILASGSVSPTPDMMGLAASQTLGFISQDSTAIVGVNRLLGGYFLKMLLTGPLTIAPYWSFSNTFSKAYSAVFDSSLDIYCELERQIGQSIQTHQSDAPACLSGELGSYLIWNKLKDKEQNTPLVTLDITPQQFLDSLVGLVWSMEMPNANIDAARQWHFIKWCVANGKTPYFDTGFAQEFYDYTKDALKLYEAHHAHQMIDEITLKDKLAFSWAPKWYLQKLKKSQAASPQMAFLEKKLMISSHEFAKSAPILHRHFDLDVFIHQFYHLSRISKLDASLFYLAMKTSVTDGISESRLRLAQAHGLHTQSPFIDWRLLEFFASFSPEIWASPDLLAAFPSFWLKEHEVTIDIATCQHQPAIPEKLLLSPDVWQVLKGLDRGFLAESGLISAQWVKRALCKPQAHLQSLYAMLILEIWMRLFVDLPLREENKDIPLRDLLQR